MRLFAAIPVPEFIQSQLEDLQAPLAGARWLPKENLHLTLEFYGERSVGDFQRLSEALEEVDFSPFELCLNQFAIFGSREPRVLFAQAENEKACKKLFHNIRRVSDRLKIPVEKRKFIPHVTLARLKNVSPPAIASFIENTAFPALRFQVESFVIFESTLLKAGGSVYTPRIAYYSSEASA